MVMKNEVLCKIICHNICCLIQEIHELGIAAEFWKGHDDCTKLWHLHNNRP
jgi:hypothetical protein